MTLSQETLCQRPEGGHGPRGARDPSPADPGGSPRATLPIPERSAQRPSTGECERVCTRVWAVCVHVCACLCLGELARVSACARAFIGGPVWGPGEKVL